ncbi:PspC domain-containing protein [Bizionia saleffrena]|uniref:PspC domain-containing protein n=1 Tax=Bizionia saleffrena TaxID=291189 RepID=A0A8H2LEH3_9FLAO|nr:PspC domain-containing protein [Bizionia saleffrena]TYB77496.1 PspC domain-containing protein [Bizionia saleffrena]
MNKTVNINLAGIFYHIDEDAYLKLQRYLEAIKRAFTDSQGRSEIIADIEARIAELFTERVKHDKHVIGIKEVDAIISIMGQPEDYLVDDEIFEDEPKQSRHQKTDSKKLFRDTDNSYISGVSAGLGHYFGLNAIWIRLAWILLVFGFGTGIFLYIILWILIPEAKTTSDKIIMTGERVTISNIEKKIRDGFENVSESVKNVDLQKHGSRIKSSSKSFFDTIAEVIMFFLKLFAKFIGVILLFAGAAAVIALIVGLISVSVLDHSKFFNSTIMDLSNASGAPFWLLAVFLFFAFAIPFFMLFYLGLKILVNNLKSIGNVAKFTLLGLWILSLIGLSVIGARQGLSYSEKAPVVIIKKLETVTAKDTLVISMKANDHFADNFYRSTSFNYGYNKNGDEVTYSQDVRLIIKSTRDSVAKIKVLKTARGATYQVAKERAKSISYNYTITNSELVLDNHLLIPNDHQKRDQRVEITVYLPLGSTLLANENTYRYHKNDSRHNDILDNGMENYYLKVENNTLRCLNCPADNDGTDDDFEVNIDINTKDGKLKINDKSLEAKNQNAALEINDDGIKAKSETVNVTIDESGININSESSNQ